MGRASFEINKGIRQVLTLSEADVEKLLDLPEMHERLATGFRDLELGKVQVPPRPLIEYPGKELCYCLAMPAWQEGMHLAVKIVSFSEPNLASNLPNHLALIVLVDPQSGAISCVMDGTYVTAVRTSGSGILAARLLSREDSRVATVVGAGVQGRQFLRQLPLIRDLDHINVCSLHFEDAEKMAGLEPKARAVKDIETAIRESDIVCMAAHSPTPVIRSEWVKSGTHVSSVGFLPPDGELPKDLARNHHLFVEALDACAPPPVGCGELAEVDPGSATTLGAVILGKAPGRRDDREITIYKAMGIGMEDMVVANMVFQRAQREQAGGRMDW